MKPFPSDLRDCAILGGVDFLSEARMKASGMARNPTDVTGESESKFFCVKIIQLTAYKEIDDAICIPAVTHLTRQKVGIFTN